MANDPAFLFYPGDYLRDTQCLSESVQVAYDRIMCEHMRNICISHEQLKFFTKRLNEAEKAELLHVLTEVEGGYQISWVAASICKRKAYSENRRINRIGKKAKKDNNICSTYDEHMENENENINEVILVSNVRELEESKVSNGGFNQKPKQEDFTDPLPEMTMGSIQELLRITKNADVTAEHIERMFAVFKVQNLTGKKFYPDRDAVYSHFINWCRSQDWTKHEVSKPSTKNKFKPRPI